MPNNIVKYAFIAGELSPSLWGRTDLTKYDLGLADTYNFFIDYRGGALTRPGTEFCDYARNPEAEVKLFDFKFSPDLSNTYIMVFSDNSVSFMQDGAYVLETATLSITDVTQSNSPVVTSAAHGLTAGEWIKISGVVGMTQLNGQTYEVYDPDVNTFKLRSPSTGRIVHAVNYDAYVSGGTISTIYELTTPYAAADLADLEASQYRDTVRLTHPDYPPYDLVRVTHNNWTITATDISPRYDGPTISSASDSPGVDEDGNPGTAQVVFCVTAVYDDVTETLQGNLYRLTTIINYTNTEGSVSINWGKDDDAQYYNVYRSIVSSEEALTEGTEFGYVGKSYSTKFTDPNIIPDFTKQPPLNRNPFAPGAIEKITITNQGAGYSAFGTTISITDPDGSGFRGQVVLNGSGEIANVIILSPGSGYTAPVVSFSGGGAGATATATVSELTGTNPRLSLIHQQRQFYAATTNEPINIYGSQIKRFDNFNESQLVTDRDSVEFTLDSNAVAPILHILPARGGLLVMTQETVWMLNGGAANTPITPSNALADPQTYTGVSGLRPIFVGPDLVYTEGRGYAVRMLAYNEISKIYSGDDRSILANHLFSEDKTIVSWAYQESPHKVIWAVRSDGALLAFTVVKDEDVFAWTKCFTKGAYQQVVSIREGNNDRVYAVVKRRIGKNWTQYIERFDLRDFRNVEDAWCVDAGLTNEQPTPAADIYFTVENDVYTVFATAGVFTGTEGFCLRAADGIFTVSTVLAASSATVTKIVAPTNFIPETDNSITFLIEEGDWTLTEPVTEFSGLSHLNGEQVSALADGNVVSGLSVSNGRITLPQAASKVIVGLPFQAYFRTLPLVHGQDNIEAQRKRTPALAVRLGQSRGLTTGVSLDRMYEIRDRTTEAWGTPTTLINGIKHMLISTSWDTEAQTYFRQTNPLPISVYGIVFDMEVGDDPD